MPFRQVAILVEGQTEAAFVGEILAPYLQNRGVLATPVIVTTSRRADGKAFKGGGTTWRHYENDLRKLLGATHFRAVSVLVDFYAYPSNGPGASCCPRPHVPRRCAENRIEAMRAAIDHPRFVPYVVLHEFETWVIAAALAAGDALGETRVADELSREAAAVGGDVELLNDSEQTAPSKRVLRRWPEYAKVTDGVEVIREAGLDAVLEWCPGLRSWVDQLLA